MPPWDARAALKIA